MNRITCLLAVAAFVLASSSGAFASVLGTYTFTGLTDLPAAATSVDPGVTVSDLSEGAGSTFSVVNSPTSNTLGDVAQFVYSSVSNTDEAGAVNNNVYIEFTVTPQSTVVDFDTLSWVRSADTTSSTRKATFFIRSDTDSFTTTLDSQVYSSSSPQKDASLDISALTGVSTATTFRVYYYDNSGSGGKVFVDDLTVNGTVVPEPATLALLGLGGLAFIRRKK